MREYLLASPRIFPTCIRTLPKEELNSRTVIGSDQCIVDSKWFFLRGIVEIPIIGNDEPFVWGLWASVLEQSFDEISDCWELQGRGKSHGPLKGRLANSLSTYPETLNLKVSIILQPVGARPLFVIEDFDHPLSVQQQSGISKQEAIEFASLLLHLEGREMGHS